MREHWATKDIPVGIPSVCKPGHYSNKKVEEDYKASSPLDTWLRETLCAVYKETAPSKVEIKAKTTGNDGCGKTEDLGELQLNCEDFQHEFQGYGDTTTTAAPTTAAPDSSDEPSTTTKRNGMSYGESMPIENGEASAPTDEMSRENTIPQFEIEIDDIIPDGGGEDNPRNPPPHDALGNTTSAEHHEFCTWANLYVMESANDCGGENEYHMSVTIGLGGLPIGQGGEQTYRSYFEPADDRNFVDTANPHGRNWPLGWRRICYTRFQKMPIRIHIREDDWPFCGGRDENHRFRVELHELDELRPYERGHKVSAANVGTWKVIYTWGPKP